ncbi:MAG: RNA 2',3'-cyclic phosphodiesterase [Rhodobacteraceae bacterium]|nr:RNA 2',3'-cyclic phosphodiesterase [Paracoccaceae bacterium]
MIRVFVALPVPEPVRADLARLQSLLPLPRPLDPEGFHLTLAFLGDLPEPQLDEAHLALGALHPPVFSLAVQGAALFGGDRPRVVYAALVPDPTLITLKAKVETALRRVGLEPEARRFTPHVTLGRVRPNRAEVTRLQDAVAATTGFAAAPWPVEGFGLWRSDPAPGGRGYTEMVHYPPAPSRPTA